VPVVGAIAALLLATAAVDLVLGRTVLADEMPHLLTVAGFLLLWRLAKVNGDDHDGQGAWSTPPRVDPAEPDPPAWAASQNRPSGGPRPLAGEWREVSGL